MMPELALMPPQAIPLCHIWSILSMSQKSRNALLLNSVGAVPSKKGCHISAYGLSRPKACSKVPGLKELGGTHDMSALYNAVEALMVVHNLCISLDDHPEDIWDYDPSDDTMVEEEEEEDGDSGIQNYGNVILQRVQLPGRETEAWLKAHGIAKRLELLTKLCPIEEF